MTHSWETFFRLVLPADGPHQYCIGYGADGPTYEAFVPTMAGLFQHADNLATQGASTGAAYFSIAALQVQQTGKQVRNQQLCVGTRTLLLDIDVRPNLPTHHSDLLTAVKSLFSLCAQGLPQPSAVIHSGQGAHVYWALDETISGVAYGKLGTMLADYIKARDPKLVADPKPTKNCVTFIRMPGSTNNRVQPPHIVDYYTPGGVQLGTGVPHSVQTFANLFGVNRSVLTSTNVVPISPGQASFGHGRVIDPIEPLKTAQDYYDTCAVMRYLKAQKTTPAGSADYVSYDAWRCGIALLSRAEDAATAVHEFSEDAPTYEPARVDRQLAIEQRNNATTTGPITCDVLCSHIAHGRALCQGCPAFKPNGGSPYRAAKTRETERAVAAAATSVGQLPTQSTPQVINQQPTQQAPLEIVKAKEPSPDILEWQRLQMMVEAEAYVPMDALGVTKDPKLWNGQDFPLMINSEGELTGSVADSSGNYQAVFLANSVIWPLRYVSRTDGDKSDIQVCIAKYEDNQWLARLGTVNYDIAGGGAAAFKQELLGFQVVVGFNPKAQAQLLKWFQNRLSRLRSADTLSLYNSFGWHTDGGASSFVLGHYVFKPGGVTQIASLGAATKQHAKQYFPIRGSFEGARSVINYIWHHGTDEAKLALMLGAGAPMTYKSSTPGAYINLWGSNGTGKSLIASIIRGMWGDGGAENSHITAKDTLNGYYAVMSAFKNLPVIFDEATEVHQAQVKHLPLGTILYDTSHGKGKGRARKDGSSAAVANWNTLLIATSNAYIRDNYEGIADDRDAKVARAYEINIDKPVVSGKTVGDVNSTMMKLGSAMTASSGVAGLSLARYLVDHKDRLEQTLDGILHWLTKNETQTDADAKIRRAVLAIAMVGGQMLADTNLWDATHKDVVDVVLRTDKKVQAQSKQSKQNPLDVLNTMAHNLMGSMDFFKETANGNVTNIARSANGDADKAYAKYDMKGRLVSYVDTGVNKYIILEETAKEYLARRGINLKELMKRVRDMGIAIRKERVDLYNDSKYPARTEFSVPAPGVSVPCIVFELKASAGGTAGVLATLPANAQVPNTGS